jgi:hypothetical protein
VFCIKDECCPLVEEENWPIDLKTLKGLLIRLLNKMVNTYPVSISAIPATSDPIAVDPKLKLSPN